MFRSGARRKYCSNDCTTRASQERQSVREKERRLGLREERVARKLRFRIDHPKRGAKPETATPAALMDRHEALEHARSLRDRGYRLVKKLSGPMTFSIRRVGGRFLISWLENGLEEAA